MGIIHRVKMKFLLVGFILVFTSESLAMPQDTSSSYSLSEGVSIEVNRTDNFASFIINNKSLSSLEETSATNKRARKMSKVKLKTKQASSKNSTMKNNIKIISQGNSDIIEPNTSTASISNPLEIIRTNIVTDKKKSTTNVLVNLRPGMKIESSKTPLRISTVKATSTGLSPRRPTSKPITIKLTTKSSRPNVRTTRTRIKPAKFSLKASAPTTKRPKKRKKRPTIHKIVTKWSDTPILSEIKQNWYEPDVPYPNPNPEIISPSPGISLGDLSTPVALIPTENSPTSLLSAVTPMPEISSYSPPFSISNTPDIIPELPSVPDLSSAVAGAVENPISVFNLDMVPDGTRIANGAAGSPCPTVHISSSVLGPQGRQECSDLNLVINSHIHQNTGGGGATRSPPISTYQGLGAEDPAVEAAEEAPVQADPGTAADPGLGTAADPVQAVAADPGQAASGIPAQAAASPPAAGTGGTGGTGGNGSNGGNGPFQFPDLKHMFEAIGYLWRGLGHLLSFLKNPYLYIVPAVLFFLLGFFKVLALFPWWIPVLLLYLGIKTDNKPKNQVTFYKHVHKPVQHPDGWFWNHQTKTWQNVKHFPHKRIDSTGNEDLDRIHKIVNGSNPDLDRIHAIVRGGGDTSLQKWKRRKRP